MKAHGMEFIGQRNIGNKPPMMMKRYFYSWGGRGAYSPGTLPVIERTHLLFACFHCVYGGDFRCVAIS